MAELTFDKLFKTLKEYLFMASGMIFYSFGWVACILPYNGTGGGASGLALVLCSGFLTFLQDLTMIIVAVMFLTAGITACLVSGMPGKDLASSFCKGMISILPATAMILMASSIKYILTEANILDTLLHYAVLSASDMPLTALPLMERMIFKVLASWVMDAPLLKA